MFRRKVLSLIWTFDMMYMYIYIYLHISKFNVIILLHYNFRNFNIQSREICLVYKKIEGNIVFRIRICKHLELFLKKMFVGQYNSTQRIAFLPVT